MFGLSFAITMQAKQEENVSLAPPPPPQSACCIFGEVFGSDAVNFLSFVQLCGLHEVLYILYA